MNPEQLPNPADLKTTLSKQEIQVLYLALDENSNKEISSKLYIAESTLKVHKRNICRKYAISGKVAFRKFLLSVRKMLQY